MSAGIGIDLVRVDDVAAALDRFGDRYVRRTFSADEAEEARALAEPAEFLAGRFAAKEAVWKSLDRDSGVPLSWRDIAVVRRGGRGPAVQLHGPLAGIAPPAVSISHEGAYAVACALAVSSPDTPAAPPADPIPVPRPTTAQGSVMNRSTIVDVLDRYGKLSRPAAGLSDTDNLYDAGMTSHASVSVMLGLEDALDIEFPDELLSRDTFSTIAAIEKALGQLA